VTSEDVECSGYPSTHKTEENVEQVKETVLEDRKSVTMKLLTCWEFHLCQFRVFLRQSENVSDCHQICALPAERGEFLAKDKITVI
jgi:hypothetical protein